MKARVAICFLVVNNMGELSSISISSAFEKTGADLFLGYLDETDLPNLPSTIKFTPMLIDDVNVLPVLPGRPYSDFSEDNFYKIVQYKWKLLQKVLSLDYDYVIYSDTDVYWNVDPTSEISSNFELRPEVHLQIQSFTDFPSKPKLCMGFVALRNSKQSHDFLLECQDRHFNHSTNKGRIGDDDIVTQYYLDNKLPESIYELPQTTFPVGRMLNLYSKKSKYPGMPSPTPYIFHANYVIGIRNKVTLMKLFINNYSVADSKKHLGFQSLLLLHLQRIRLRMSRLKTHLHID